MPAGRGLDQVPASAPLVIHVRGVEGSKGRLLALLDKALPDVAPLVKARLDQLHNDGIEGRKLRGLAKDGPLFVVFREMPAPGEEPKVAVLAAVTSYTEFRDNLLKEDERKGLKGNGRGVERAALDNGNSLFFVDRKGYAVVSPNEEVANSFTEKRPGLDGKISKVQAEKLLRADLGLYLSMDAFNKQYAEQVKQAREQVDAFLKQAASSVTEQQKRNMEVARQMLGPVFQAVEDSQGLLVTFELRPAGLAFHAQTELRSDSPSARALAGSRTAAFEHLGQLPTGQLIYTGMQANPALFKAINALAFAASDPGSKEAKPLQSALEQLEKAGPGERVDATSVPLSALQVWQFEDPARAVQAQLRLIRSLGVGGTFQTTMLKEKPTIRTDAETYGDFKLHYARMVWDVDKMAGSGAGAGLPEEARKQMIEATKKFLGSEAHIWLGTDGKVFVQVTAKDWTSAKKLLDDYFQDGQRVGSVTPFREVRKELPARASFLLLADLPRYVGLMVDIFKPMTGGAIRLPPGYPAPGSSQPTYVGAAITLEPRRGSFDFFLSASATREIYDRFVKPFRGAGE